MLNLLLCIVITFSWEEATMFLTILSAVASIITILTALVQIVRWIAKK